MQLIFGQDDLVANWVFTNLELPVSPPYVAIGGTTDDKTLSIGVVFNQWNGSNAEITLFGPGALRRGCIRAIYHYAFVQVGFHRLTATTRRSNKKMLRLLPRFGFNFEGISKQWFGPHKADDGMRFALFPENAQKWMKYNG